MGLNTHGKHNEGKGMGIKAPLPHELRTGGSKPEAALEGQRRGVSTTSKTDTELSAPTSELLVQTAEKQFSIYRQGKKNH